MRKVNLPKDLLEDLYVANKMTLREVADELGVSRQTIANKLKSYSITIRNGEYLNSIKKVKVKLVKRKKYRDKAEFEKVYKELKSIDLVAKHFNLSVKTAFQWKKIHNIPTIKAFSHKGKYKVNCGKPYANKEWLEDMYSKYSLEDLSKMLNCHPSTIGKWCKRFGIKTRSIKEQWDLKSKNVARVLKNVGFDLQTYKNSYDLDSIKTHLPKNLKAYIISLYGKCECCGYSEVLDLHHIDFNHGNNKPSNHSVLCPNCHAKIHRLGIKFNDLVKNHISWDTLVSYNEAK